MKFDGSKGNKNYRVSSNKGVVYRCDSLDNTTLAAGTLDRVGVIEMNRQAIRKS